MKLDIPAGEFAGYIFDLDGTLVDTMPLHFRAWEVAMREAGLAYPLDEDLFYSLGGVPTRRVAELIAAHYGLQIDPEAVFHHKEALFRELQGDARLIGPVVDFARDAPGFRGIGRGTVSLDRRNVSLGQGLPPIMRTPKTRNATTRSMSRKSPKEFPPSDDSGASSGTEVSKTLPSSSMDSALNCRIGV